MEIEEKIGKILRERGLTIATAESCTGGLIADRITNVNGASQYFEAGFITYSNRAKCRFLSVPEEVIAKHGAVSAETAGFMARGAKAAASADMAVAVTGIAGPTGGTPQKPVGTVFMALAITGGNTLVRGFAFKGDRKSIKDQTAREALALILDSLEGNLG